jgi:hypothetical protein
MKGRALEGLHGMGPLMELHRWPEGMRPTGVAGTTTVDTTVSDYAGRHARQSHHNSRQESRKPIDNCTAACYSSLVRSEQREHLRWADRYSGSLV